MNRSDQNYFSEDNTIAIRQRWLHALAHAGQSLEAYNDQLKSQSYEFIRTPEIGMVMARGRMAGKGYPFNLGEVTVTRCVILNSEGTTGFGYVIGHNKLHAELCALADSYLQGSKHSEWMKNLIEPLEEKRKRQIEQELTESANTQVSFYTMVRGEDA